MGAKHLVLVLAKWAGLFRLARRVTARKLRILCYHGFQVDDECAFRPGLFISPGEFDRRMEYVRRRFRVLPLGEAVDLLYQDRLPPGSVCITVDDGFRSTADCLLASCVRRGLPATVYLTTYYMEQQEPVFRLAVQYMFWRTTRPQADFSDLVAAPANWRRQSGDADAVMWQVIRYGEDRLAHDSRSRLAGEIGSRLGVDYQAIRSSGKLSLMGPDAVRSLHQQGVDIQLHTHRHRLPEEPALARGEIDDNRRSLAGVVPGDRQHLCYPSGIWSAGQFATLGECGIVSATTTDVGLNTRFTPRLALCRFLDSHQISPIVFEAELSGFLELCRVARRAARRVLRAFGGRREAGP